MIFAFSSSFQQSGVGSRASSGSWKTALAAGALGAVGGVVAWEAGTVDEHIDHPLTFLALILVVLRYFVIWTE